MDGAKPGGCLGVLDQRCASTELVGSTLFTCLYSLWTARGWVGREIAANMLRSQGHCFRRSSAEIHTAWGVSSRQQLAPGRQVNNVDHVQCTKSLRGVVASWLPIRI